MNPNQIAAFKILEQAQQALKSGDKNLARQLASQAAQLAPDLEEVWLLLAALASPQGSVAHLEKALQINPGSERAQKGLVWARSRLQNEQASKTLVAQPVALQEPVSAKAEVKPAQLQPEVVVERPVVQTEVTPDLSSEAEPIPTQASQKTSTRSRFSYVIPLVIVIILVLAWVGWKSATPVTTFLGNVGLRGQEHGPAWVEVEIAKSEATLPAVEAPSVVLPTLPVQVTATSDLTLESVSSGLATVTPTLLPTELPQPTATLPSPTLLPPSASPTPLPTDVISTFTAVPPTVQPTATQIVFVPTQTFVPTNTPIPTNVVQPTATPNLNSSQPSPTPLPTDTAQPGPTQYIPPTVRPNTGGSTGGEHWIDINLTNQTVYAYEGNTVVNSFVVSTGTWQHPTVTGQYRVYVKYRYTDMSGPGYYLPNVPFTMYFYQGYALHGTYWHSNFGTPMSHGCVNFSIPDAEWIYNFSTVGTLVNVHN
jgi:lipoprotein-anchoring transpeptidase ErfK/SrfK